MTSTAQRQRRPPDNKPSQLLSPEENQILYHLIGRKCVSLASAVVQVLMSSPPSNSAWVKVYCGVACFVKDSSYRSYFIRVFDVHSKSLFWEQELYSEFVYETPRAFFHCFEADKCQVGLNFADQEEARLFEAAVNQKLYLRRQKIAEKRRSQSETNGIKPSATGVTMSTLGRSTEMIARKKKIKNKDKKDTKKKITKITKADIGTPTDFIHVQHVGFDPRKGFDCMNSQEIDPQLKDFFNVAGVNEHHLADEKTRNFIYDFINKNGGIDAFNNELQKEHKAPPPIPAREVAPTPTLQHRLAAPAPPPPPARAPPPMISPSRTMTAPPPPPPPSMPRGAPPQPQRMPAVPVSKASAPVPPPPPPPPPPPLQMQPPAPPPPPPPMGGGGAPQGLDTRSALFDQIRKGAALHHVDPASIEPAPRQESGDSRGALLDQIRKGVELKTVAELARSRPPSPPILNGLAAALNKALQERSKALQSSDDSDSEEDEDYDDDEWED